MSEQADQFDERDDNNDDDDAVREPQEKKGYGADEGERADALPEE